jgi:hypothetical protein
VLRTKAKPTAVWTKLTLRAENSEDGNSPFELRCINCDSKCQLRNPAKWNSEHKCKGAKTQLKMAFEKAGPGVQQFVVTPAQEAAFKSLFFKSIVTSNIAFNYLENQQVKDCFKLMGMKPPTRRQAAGKYLDELTEESKMFSKLSVALMDFPHGASDGWRKKYCNQGAGLMNSAVMGNSGALLFKVMDCSDVRKDAAGISELLSTMGAEIMGGEAQASGFGGWTVDNTRTSMAALSRLEVSRPTWICVGCIAHGLGLAITDFAGQMNKGAR